MKPTRVSSAQGLPLQRGEDAGDGDASDGPRQHDALATWAQRLITFDGRFPEADVSASLTLEGRAILATLGGLQAQGGEPPPGPSGTPTSGARCYVGAYDYGRAYLSLRPPESPHLKGCAWAEVSPAQVEQLNQAVAALEPERSAGDAEMNAFLEGTSADQLAVIVAGIEDFVDHNDPVLLYVEDECFNNMGPFNNLLRKGRAAPADRYILGRLRGLPVEQIPLGQRRFLFSMHAILRAGLRPEAFNGTQLTPWSVRAYFARKYQQYQSTTANALAHWPPDLMGQADVLCRHKSLLNETHEVYRWINGLTLRKEERWRPRVDWSDRAPDLPALVTSHCLERYQVSLADFSHHDPYFQAVVDAISDVSEGPERSLAYEALLEVIVRSAMSFAPSHAGMTRGMRDLRHFQDAVEEGRLDDACAAPMADGFCAVFPHDDTGDFCRPQPLSRVLTAISARMQFNHWHYTPGHFESASFTGGRHYYYPPSMSDLTEEAEFHHGGHAIARVRHAIRSPAPLVIGGHSYPGLVDIRLMRAVGRPYTTAELRDVDHHTEMIRSIAQATLSLKTRGRRAPVVTHFRRADFELQYPSDSNRQAAPQEQGPEPTPISTTLQRALSTHTDRVAMTCAATRRTITRGAIAALSGRLADLTGGTPGATVVVACGDRFHQAAFISAGLAAGLIVCPLDPAMPSAALTALLRTFAPALVVADANSALHAPDLGQNSVQAEALLASAGAPNSAQASPPRPLPDQGRGGLLVYTSGATGSPKAVMLTERQISANVAFAVTHFGYDEHWVSASLLPLHHTFTIISDVLPVLSAGGQVLITRFSVDDAGSLTRDFRRHNVRSYSAVPIIIATILALRVELPDTLRFAITGAAPLPEASRNRYSETHGHQVLPCYGLTESVCFATATARTGGRPGTVGTPAGIQLRILGGDLQPLPPLHTGEIAIRGPSVVTRDAFKDRSAMGRDVCLDDGWFLTGDMGHVDEDGHVTITGRRKHMIIRGGEKIYLEDLDRCLQDHPSVLEACCVQVPGRFGIERAVAFVVAAGEQPDDRALLDYIHDNVGSRGGPDELIWTDKIPRSATGKPLRASLLHRVTASSAHRTTVDGDALG
jgi:acyl-CoA synthetase (AMP-forming)/AMP-acid ligase II